MVPAEFRRELKSGGMSGLLHELRWLFLVLLSMQRLQSQLPV